MNAKITYRMNHGPDPFDEKAPKNWVLWKETWPEVGCDQSGSEPVAVFSNPREARIFMAHVWIEKSGLVRIPQDLEQAFERDLKYQTEQTALAKINHLTEVKS